jgi:hypothetical protein
MDGTYTRMRQIPLANPQEAMFDYYRLVKHCEMKSMKGVSPMLKDPTRWDQYAR